MSNVIAFCPASLPSTVAVSLPGACALRSTPSGASTTMYKGASKRSWFIIPYKKNRRKEQWNQVVACCCKAVQKCKKSANRETPKNSSLRTTVTGSDIDHFVVTSITWGSFKKHNCTSKHTQRAQWFSSKVCDENLSRRTRTSETPVSVQSLDSSIFCCVVHYSRWKRYRKKRNNIGHLLCRHFENWYLENQATQPKSGSMFFYG